MKTKISKPAAINVVTMGCSKNLVDSEVLMRQIDASSVKVYHNETVEKARTVIINTCGFISDAKQESIDTILQFAKAKGQGDIDNLYVMGCLAERYKDDLIKEIPEVDNYFGVNNISDIISTIGIDYKTELTGERFLTTPQHFAYLKISEGCDRTCSFCAIPLIRGKHRSKPMEQLMAEARQLAAQGVKELILIAQDLTYYGVDLYRKQLLPGLLANLADIKGLEWLRLHYTYPASFPRELLTVMKERQNVCSYIDMPVQHINNTVLANMRRNHNSSLTKALLDKIRIEVPGITLRTTLLVGHPGEDEAAFDELLAFVRQQQFNRLGVFTYSEEENTFSARNFKDSVPEKIKQRRMEIILAEQRDISEKLNLKLIGKVMKVLVDRKEGDFYIARTEGDSPEVDNEVLIEKEGNRLEPGCFYNVIITASDHYDLTARLTSG